MSATNALEKIEQLNPSDLRPHPLKKQLPRAASWLKGGEDFNRLTDDIRDRGIITPLLINSTGEILDGELRWLAAKQLKLNDVPTLSLVCPQAASVILGGLLQRQHLTKSALAYLAYPLMATAHTEARNRHHARLRTGNAATIVHGVNDGRSVDEIAERMGVGRVMFSYAARLHEAFTKTAALRTQFEPLILSGEMALGACLAGIAGQTSTAGKAKQTAAQLDLFTDGFDVISKRFSYWQKFDEVTREKARATIHRTVADMPEDLREEFEKAIRLVKKSEGRKVA
jgi:hypothetical protein